MNQFETEGPTAQEIAVAGALIAVIVLVCFYFAC